MKTGRFVLIPLLSLVLLTLSFAQSEEEEFIQTMTIKPGIGFEYFNREVDLFSKDADGEWEEDEADSRLKSYFLTLSVEFGLQGGFTFTPLIGYSVSDYESIVFRKLPFSIDLDADGFKGFLVGAELRKSLISVKDFAMEASGQILYYAGKKQEWSVPGLNVEGSVEGKPRWLRGTLGSVIVYKGFDYIFPYLGISYSKFWGKFKLDQEILDLTGEEEKKITAKGNVVLSPGAIYELSRAFILKGEANVIPRKGGLDFGILARVMFSF